MRLAEESHATIHQLPLHGFDVRNEEVQSGRATRVTFGDAQHQARPAGIEERQRGPGIEEMRHPQGVPIERPRPRDILAHDRDLPDASMLEWSHTPSGAN